MSDPEAVPEVTPETSRRDSLPDDLRESTALKDVADVDSLAKQFVDQGKFLGNSIRLPGPDATDEARQEFRQRLLDKNVGLMETPDLSDPDAMGLIYDTLGRPKEASEYTKPEDGIDDARFNLMSQAAHEAGISNKQFEKVVGKIIAADKETMDAMNTERETGLTGLRDEWSSAYDGEVKKAAKLAELTGAPAGLVDAINAGKVDAGTLKWLDSLGASIGGETAEVINQGMGGETGITKQEAKDQAGEILRALADMPQNDPRYQGLMEKRLKLTEIYAG